MHKKQFLLLAIILGVAGIIIGSITFVASLSDFLKP